jgi:hypothetical protein
LLEDITGKQRGERHPIFVSGDGIDQLLAVPKLTAGTGEAAATAVFDCAVSWGLCDIIKAAKFAITSLRVVNDIAEQGVALMDEYNKLHTNDEEQK